MRKMILIAVIVFSLISFGQLMAWDTTAAKYLPLQVGNVWVYEGYSQGYPGWQNRYYTRYKITGTLDTLGHGYYVYDRTVVWIVNVNGWSCIQFIPLRIDSTSVNVYQARFYCNVPEMFIDSLMARRNDRTIVCAPYYYSECWDTTLYYIFNTNFPSKAFEDLRGPGYNTIYAKGIGIVEWSQAYGMNSCHDQLKGCVINGVLRGDTTMIVGLVNIGNEIPKEFSLYQNFPNPFNPVTKIKFDVPAEPKSKGASPLVLKICDILGREVATLVNEILKPGTYVAEWDATNYPSGMYFYKLQAGDYSETKKMVLLK